MSLNQAGVDLILFYEGFEPLPYDDPANNCTVGYGELLHLGPCTPWDLQVLPLTKAQARDRFLLIVTPYYDEVVADCPGLNENQYAALTSLCYNIGRKGFRLSSVRAAVVAGGDVCAELFQVIHGSDGLVYPGLVARREKECVLFSTPLQEDRMYTDQDIDAKVFEVLKAEIKLQREVVSLHTAVDFLIAVVNNLAEKLNKLSPGQPPAP